MSAILVTLSYINKRELEYILGIDIKTFVEAHRLLLLLNTKYKERSAKDSHRSISHMQSSL